MVSNMKFVDEEGRPLKYRTKLPPPHAHYIDIRGELRKLPSIESDYDDVYTFLEACMKSSHPHLTSSDILDVWKYMEDKRDEILTYLNAFKTANSVLGDKRREIAYTRAIKAVEEYPIPIGSKEQAMKIPSIGTGIGDKIDQIVKTGTIKDLDPAVQKELDRQEVIQLFKKVWDIGPRVAVRYYDQGYRTLEDLEEAPLTRNQRLGLKYFEEFQQKIPRKYIEKLEPIFIKILHNIDPTAKICIAGSYRRGLSVSGDIDILISSKSDPKKTLLKRYVDALTKKGILIDKLKGGEVYYQGVVDILKSPGNKSQVEARRIDIKLVPPESWATGIFHATGSGRFNRYIRTIAIKEGFTLSEYHLHNEKTGRDIPVKTEKDIFKVLGMKYVPPEKRI
jgi:DNA polymerase/3'-5' exonuclease PolX